MMTTANATVQMTTEPGMRGRVMSLYMMVFLGTTPVGSPVVGWIADTWGARWSVGAGAIASILVAVLAAAWVGRSWRVKISYSLRRRPFIVVSGPTERYAVEMEERAAAGQVEERA
jgi:MFS family permease